MRLDAFPLAVQSFLIRELSGAPEISHVGCCMYATYEVFYIGLYTYPEFESKVVTPE